MSKGIALAQNQGDFYPCSDFYTLNGIQKKQFELFVKLIKLDGVLKAAARKKAVRPRPMNNFPKGIPIGAKALRR